MNSKKETRQEAEEATKEAMDMLGVEMTKHVGVVYDSAYKAGVEKGKKEISCLLDSIAVNQSNTKLSAEQFRDFVGRVASQFSTDKSRLKRG